MNSSKALQVYSAFLACGTFFLVIAGGLVTSTDSGLAVPDWPLSFGQFFPKMEGGVFYEHGHRMVAATIGLLTVVLALWLSRTSSDFLLRRLGWFAVLLVCVQGLLGGITVLLKLPALVSVSHACLGQVFFCTICCIAAFVWSESAPKVVPEASKLRKLSLLTAGLIFFQLLFGAIYRHEGMMLHVHFLGAFLVFVHILLLAKCVQRSIPEDPWFARLAAFLVAFLFVQLALGFYTWQRPNIPNATIHQSVGALLFAASSVVAMQSFRRVKPA